MFRAFFGGGGGDDIPPPAPAPAPAPTRRTSNRDKPKAVKWLGMKQGDSRGGDCMFISEEAANRVLRPLGDQPVNLISIFGAARQGKSFLMNLLADQQDLFKISNLREPCTQGVDLSGHFVPLSEFSGVNGCSPITNAAAQQMQIGFVDAEGQGDRDITYDSRLVSPVLLTSKVVIFNWKDSLQADRILNLLAVLARAAQGIELAESDSVKVFGHLHLVFRDWSFVDSTPQQVFNDLFKNEKGRSNEVNVRNLARASLQEAFESITVWLFPPPVTDTAHLSSKIRFEQLQRPFQVKLREFRKAVSAQLQEPTRFYRQPLSASLLSSVMPVLVETLNSDQVIMPESIYSSMVRAQASALKEECEREISEHVAAAGIEEVVSSGELQKTLQEDVDVIIKNALARLANTPSSVLKDIRSSLLSFAEKEIQIALHANNEKIVLLLSKEVDSIFENLKRECTKLETRSLPMKRDSLREKWSTILQRELKRLEKVPAGLNDKRDMERESSRIRQHAAVLFDKVEIANDKAIQRCNAAMNDHLRAAKSAISDRVLESLQSYFDEKRPVSITAFLNEVETVCIAAKQDLSRQAGEAGDLMGDFISEIDVHKKQLSGEVSRRYMAEVQHILKEAEYSARDDLTREVARHLDGNLPLLNDEIKAAIGQAARVVNRNMSDKLKGWTILKADIDAKGRDLDKLADILTNDYLRRNKDLEMSADARKEREQYEELRVTILQGFDREIQAMRLPTDDDKIVSVFHKVLQKHVAHFLSLSGNKTSFDVKGLRESLTADCQQVIENQKLLNRLEKEKKSASDSAAQEKVLRERAAAAAQEKDAQISELRNHATRAAREKAAETKRLQEELLAKDRKARELAQEVEFMRAQDAQKRQLEQRVQEEALRANHARETELQRLKRELEEMRLQASRSEMEKKHLERQLQVDAAHASVRQQQQADRLQAELQALKERMAEDELQRKALEVQAQHEAELRAEAEADAARAANAAELAARYAMEAARQETSPPAASKSVAQRKRVRSGASDVEMEDVSPSPPARAPAKSSSAAAGAERKKARGPSKSKNAGPKKRMSLAEARKAAQEDVERRIQERANALAKKR